MPTRIAGLVRPDFRIRGCRIAAQNESGRLIPQQKEDVIRTNSRARYGPAGGVPNARRSDQPLRLAATCFSISSIVMAPRTSLPLMKKVGVDWTLSLVVAR